MKTHYFIFLGQINFIMFHDELPPVQHPIHYTFQKEIHILNKISVDKWKWMIESHFESHTYNNVASWNCLYHVAFRFKKPHAGLLNAKAVRQSLSWSIYRRLPDKAQVQCCPQCKVVEDWNMQPLHLTQIQSSCPDWTPQLQCFNPQ